MTSPTPHTTATPLPKGFWPLMFTQFQGAFSDNALKWLVTFLIFAKGLSEEDANAYVTKAGALFAIPFLLFSVVGGWLADRVSKRTVMIGVKVAEIGIMAFATGGLMLNSIPCQMAAICMMGVHSAFFAPAKYGILPEVLPAEKLSWGNGILEMLTFVGIILGTVFGGWLASTFGTGGGLQAGSALAALAVIGWAMSLAVPKVPASAPQKKLAWNVPAEIWRSTLRLKQDKDLWRANWGNTLFFFVSALVQMNLSLFAKFHFHLAETDQSWLQAALCLGIGAGSLLAGHFSHGRIVYGFVPTGAGLMAAACAVMGNADISQTLFTAALALLGVGGGLFIVPVAAVLQHKPAMEEKGRVQGIASWWSWIGILAAAASQALLGGHFKFTHSEIFWFCGLVAALGGLYVGYSRLGWFNKGGTHA